MKKLICLALAFLPTLAFAADLPTKASLFSKGYPTTRCGMYFGFGTGGSAGAVDGAVVGTQIVQGELDALVGYTCPFAGDAFWFVEGSVGFNNINGSVNGLALSGPLVLMQRFGVGSPIQNVFNIFPSGSISVPSLPLLPTGVTAGAGTPYAFVGLVEQDISAQLTAGHSHQWVVAPLLGIGLQTRLSNAVMVDTWAGWQMNSQAFYPGLTGQGARLGNAGRVGVSFKY